MGGSGRERAAVSVGGGIRQVVVSAGGGIGGSGCGACARREVGAIAFRRASRGSCVTLLSEGRGESLSARSCRCDLSAERCASSRESKGVSANAGEQVGQELREPER